MREGSLEAPTRHPIDWQSDEFWDQDNLNTELERVTDAVAASVYVTRFQPCLIWSTSQRPWRSTVSTKLTMARSWTSVTSAISAI